MQKRLKGQSSALQKHVISQNRRQEAFKAFEASLVNQLQALIIDWTTIQNTLSEKVMDRRTKMLDTARKLNAQDEFEAFAAANPDRLYRGETPDMKTLLSYPGMDDPLLRVVYEAPLSLRRTGMLSKGWKPHHAVVTGTGYLHLFNPSMTRPALFHELPHVGEMTISEPSHEQAKFEPDASVCLSDCVLQPFPMLGRDPDEIELKEVERSTGVFGKSPTIHVVCLELWNDELILLVKGREPASCARVVG